MMEKFIITNISIFVLLGFITVDIITGIIKATKKHRLKSAISTNGGYKKYLIIILAVMGKVIDVLFFGHDILYTFVVTYYIASEGLSIVENLALLGIPIPNRLKSVLASLNSDKE